jgi:3-phosphoshikimate 1-carboxyvinyltransferase
MALTAPSRMIVHPGRGLAGVVVAPGDKSITHRAYLLGGLAHGETKIEEPNPGADCESTLACLEALGVEIRRDPGGVVIRGRAMAFEKPSRSLDCGNSGTTLRLLAGPLAAQPFRSSLAGDASLNRRPVDRVIEPLRLMGAKLGARDGDRVPPLEIEGGPLRPITYSVPSHSAQVASCVLLAGLFAPGTTTVCLGPARDHTQRMLPAFGVPVDLGQASGPGHDGSPSSVTGPARLQATQLRVPGDFSAAAFFLAAAAATPGATVTARGVGLNPTRTGLLVALERMGATIARENLRDEGGEPVGDVTVTGPPSLEGCDLRGGDSSPALVPTMIDEIPAWAMAAARARGVSWIGGAAELRVKESDRLSALATNLRRVGVEVDERADGLSIRGGPIRGGSVDAAGDHRIAMAFAILGSLADGPITVSETREIATSYPGFVQAFRALGGEVEVPKEDPLLR